MTYNNANMNTCFVKYFNLLVKEIAVQRSATFNCSKWRPVLSNSSANDLWILRFYLYNIAWFATVICWVNSQYRAYASMNSRWICAAKKIGKQKKYVCLHRLYGSVGSFITNERLTSGPWATTACQDSSSFGAIRCADELIACLLVDRYIVLVAFCRF